jgi:3-deoxy-D-manno-octulosonic-acid transferase
LIVLRPEVVVLVEAEVWPNFLWRAKDRGIPVFLVNARLSDRSFRAYQKYARLFRPLFATFTGVTAQDEADAAKLRALGCQPEAVHVVGNLKFDAARLDERRWLDVPAMLRQLGVPEGAPVLVGGSTHAGEEALLARMYQKLKVRFPDLFLVVVPRHFERGKEVGGVLAAAGIPFAYRSEITPNRQFEPGSIGCLLVNTTGELKFFYEQATVIFVGKSLTAQGGQNPIEPGALGKAMVFGPNMQNFASIAAAFVAGNGAVQVRDAAELEQVVGALLADESRQRELGQNAVRIVSENRGAVERTADLIVQHLPREEVYRARESHNAAQPQPKSEGRAPASP